MIKRIPTALLVAFCLAAPAAAQTADAPPTVPAASPDVKPAAPAPLTIYFETGSTKIRNEDREVLDKASRAYNEGKPVVMILTGSSDRTGQPEDNLELSQRRAAAVLEGLINRGIPADRFQVLAKGETDLPIPTDRGVAEPKNRRVDISWR